MGVFDGGKAFVGTLYRGLFETLTFWFLLFLFWKLYVSYFPYSTNL